MAKLNAGASASCAADQRTSCNQTFLVVLTSWYQIHTVFLGGFLSIMAVCKQKEKVDTAAHCPDPKPSARDPEKGKKVVSKRS